MKVSIDWLKELVEIKDIDEVIHLLPLRTIGTKEVTKNYIELDMKGYNRTDLLSLRGVAYEIAAIIGSKVKFDEQLPFIRNDFAIIVTIEDSKLCPIYCVAKIENLKVEQSNETWVKKLSDCGIRTVNNIADVTNLVMLEYGQPLHAFDADKVRGSVRVRVTKKGEKLTTIDHKTNNLAHTDLLITDESGPIAIAGVMGGTETEISSSTSTLLLEAAIFNPVSLRATATRLGIQSEASKRFYQGLTKKRLFQALSAAIKIYENLGGRLTALSIVGDLEDKEKTIVLTKEKLDSLIGIEISEDETETLLEKLHFSVIRTSSPVIPTEVEESLKSRDFSTPLRSARNDKSWYVTPPYWRLDINIEEDLVEEVARMYGYEKIPAKELKGKIPPKIDQSLFELIYKLKTSLVDAGLTEIQTYSFVSTQIITNLQLPINNLVKISNPISSETEYLRKDLWPNLLEKVAENLRNGSSEVAVFEVGKVYHPKEDGVDEQYRLSIALCNGTDNPIQELYQISNVIASGAKQSKPSKIATSPASSDPRNDGLFHPTRFLQLENGLIAEIHPRVVNKFGIEKRVAVLEIELTSLL